jgi:hypothetical protein
LSGFHKILFDLKYTFLLGNPTTYTRHSHDILLKLLECQPWKPASMGEVTSPDVCRWSNGIELCQCGDKLAEVAKDESVGCSDILLCGDLKSGIVGSNTD